MRDYKFRGKRLGDGKWVSSNIFIFVDRSLKHPIEIFDEASKEWYKVDPATVGQYTGLKDKNGKEIYEGDVLKIPDLYETPENTYMTYHNEAIDFKNYTFNLGDDPLCDDYEYISDECEVIGNIHDNPELLEG